MKNLVGRATVRGAAIAAFALFIGFTGCAPQESPSRTEIVIDGARAFPENITAMRDGTIFTGSVGTGGVLRALPGSAKATQWIAPGDHGLLDTFGVLADEGSGTLWVCSSRMDPPTVGAIAAEPAVYRYDLKTGAFQSRHPFPGSTGLCNDIAIGPDGAAYATDTSGGRILRLPAAGRVLQEWAKTADLAGADGLDFLGRQLIVNSFTSGKLLRIELRSDGSAGHPIDMKTSRPLVQPDGMRRMSSNRLVLAEGSGTIGLLTMKGDTVDVKSLRSGLIGPAGVAVVGDIAWISEAKLSMRGTRDARAAPFKAYAVALHNR